MKPLWKKIKDWYYVVSGQAERDAVAKVIRQMLNADSAARGIPADLEGYRQKFRRNLLGYWVSNYAYAGPFPETRWEFFEDGIALESHSSGMTGNARTHYQWREFDDFTIELLELETETDEDATEEWKTENWEDDEPSTWRRLSYDFKLEDESIVLFQTPENEYFKFGMSSEYLAFQGDHPKEKREEN